MIAEILDLLGALLILVGALLCFGAAVALEQEQCSCGHSRKNHRGNGQDKCIICHCKTFEETTR